MIEVKVVNIFEYKEDKDRRKKEAEKEMLEKEHRAFLSLIKSFVEIEEPQTEYLRINIFKDLNAPYGISFDFFNESELKLPAGSLLNVLLDNNVESNSDGDPYDYLLSVLLTIVPAKLDIYTFDSDCEFINSVKAIFRNATIHQVNV
jgi:hypothetical protein